MSNDAQIEQLKVRGNGAFAKGNYAESVAAYTSAIGLCDASDESSLKRGKSDESSQAEAPAHPQLAAILSNRSAAYLKLNQLTEALADAERCIKAKPTWFKAYLRLGLVLEAQKDLAGAVKALEKAVEHDPVGDEVDTKLRLFRAMLSADASNESASSATTTATSSSSSGLKPATKANMKRVTARPSLYHAFTTVESKKMRKGTGPHFYPSMPQWWKMDPKELAEILFTEDTYNIEHCCAGMSKLQIASQKADFVRGIKMAADYYKIQHHNDLAMARLASAYHGRTEPMTLADHVKVAESALHTVVMSDRLKAQLGGSKLFTKTDLFNLGDDYVEVPNGCDPKTRMPNPSQLNLSLDFEIRCEGCHRILDMPQPPCCECGEFYCSEDCLKEDLSKGHINACSQARAAAERAGVTTMNAHYWRLILAGLIEYPYDELKNFSVSYKRDTTVSDPKSSQYMEEFDYLMLHERNFLAELVGVRQNKMRAATPAQQPKLLGELMQIVVLQYNRMAAYIPTRDSVGRMHFKVMMITALSNMMGAFGVSSLVEDSDKVINRFSKTLRNAPPQTLRPDGRTTYYYK